MGIRILVADDQPLVREGLVMLLDAEPDIEVVAEAGDGAHAVEQAGRHRPDVVLMDVRMPVLDGVAATRRITTEGFCADADSSITVLILSTYHADSSVYGALRAGARGFLLKDAARGELVAAVRAVASGQAWLAPPIARDLLDEFAARPEPRAPSPEIMRRLTPREQEVLTLVAAGLSNTEIATRLVVGQVTVKTHLGRILTKLGLRDRAQAVMTAYETGLVTPGALIAPPCSSHSGHPAGAGPIYIASSTPSPPGPNIQPAVVDQKSSPRQTTTPAPTGQHFSRLKQPPSR